MTETRRKPLEHRLFRIGVLLNATVSAGAWVWFGAEAALSCVVGGALAAISLHWLGRTISAVVTPHPTGSKRTVLLGYLLRLVLIPLCLYAMLRLHFLAILAVVAGFAAFIFALLIEGILEATGKYPDDNARAE